MKRKLTVITCTFLLILVLTAGCKANVPVVEELTNYGDGSTVYMPVVETGNPGLDRQINTELRARLEQCFKTVKADREGTTTEGFTAYQSGDLLSVFQEGYFIQTGEKTGESYMNTLHINIKNGTFYGLDDLLVSGYEEEVTGLVSDILDTQLEEYYLTYSPDIKGTAFDVYAEELIFIFDPQTVAPEHLGFVDAAVPFSRIDHLLKKDGEFYRAVTGGENG